MVEFGTALAQNKGRIYAQGLCIFKLDCEIRNSLLAKNYHDVDIENCHPRIIEQLAEKLNLLHNAISDYINRRKYWLTLIKGAHNYDRNQAKKLMLRLIYLGDYYKLNKVLCVVKYAKELSGIANQLWKDADKETKKFNVLSTVAVKLCFIGHGKKQFLHISPGPTHMNFHVFYCMNYRKWVGARICVWHLHLYWHPLINALTGTTFLLLYLGSFEQQVPHFLLACGVSRFLHWTHITFAKAGHPAFLFVVGAVVCAAGLLFCPVEVIMMGFFTVREFHPARVVPAAGEN